MNFPRTKSVASRWTVAPQLTDLDHRWQLLEQSRQELIVFGIKVRALQRIVVALKKRLPAEATPFETKLADLKRLQCGYQRKYREDEASLREVRLGHRLAVAGNPAKKAVPHRDAS